MITTYCAVTSKMTTYERGRSSRAEQSIPYERKREDNGPRNSMATCLPHRYVTNEDENNLKLDTASLAQ
jgi:hypothetical protein